MDHFLYFIGFVVWNGSAVVGLWAILSTAFDS